MANRIKYRKLLRQIHRIASMVIFAFLLMYFVTGFIMIRHDWFPQPEATITTKTIPFHVNKDVTDFISLKNTIKEKLEITGREDVPIQRKDSCWGYNFHRPGVVYNIVLNPNSNSLTIKKTEQKSLSRISSRLHLMHKYEGGAKYIIWAFIYDLAAVSMIVFAITGILIWLKMSNAYKNGKYYLLAGFTVSIGVLLYLLMF